MLMRVFQIAWAVIFAGTMAYANASVVMNTNVRLSTGDCVTLPSANCYHLTVLQTEPSSPNDSNPTTLFFNKTDDPETKLSTLTAVTWNVDEEADYYLAPKGSEFSAATIGSGHFSPLMVFDNGYSIQVPYNEFSLTDFYLGINTGVGSASLDPTHYAPNRDVFGWVHLRNSTNGLQMIDNAVAYGTRGIFIGTADVVPVPLPGAYILFLLGLSMFGAFCPAPVHIGNLESVLST
jgi:hypothetical protein